MKVFVSALEERTYLAAGRIMAYSLINRGPLPNFLSAKCVDRLAGREILYEMSDINDYEYKQQINEVFCYLCTII